MVPTVLKWFLNMTAFLQARTTLIASKQSRPSWINTLQTLLHIADSLAEAASNQDPGKSKPSANALQAKQ
jgi:hypothetical protein